MKRIVALAATILALLAAAMAEPDGYTLLFGSSTTLAAGPALYRNPGYDPEAKSGSPRRANTNPGFR
jgi:hypothetical protein